MTPAPNINRDDVDHFRAALYRTHADQYIDAELARDTAAWDQEPPVHDDRCRVCEFKRWMR